MALLLVNSPGSGTDLSDFGMVRACGAGLGKPGGTKQLYEVGPALPFEQRTVALKKRRLRNLSVPTNRSSKTASSTPFGLTASGGDAPRESRPACGRGGLPRAASAQFVCTRSSGRIGRAMIGYLQGVDGPVTGPGANPKPFGVRRVPQRDEGGRASEVRRDRSRSPVLPQFGL